MAEHPILFNTEMVQAILAGRKTQTRRLCKVRSIIDFRQIYHARCMTVEFPKTNYKGPCANFFDEKGEYLGAAQTPAQHGDVLWVRETWTEMPYGFAYRADGEEPEGWDSHDRWHPSIHMPRSAARIFLRVESVRAGRLQEYFDASCAHAEGIIIDRPHSCQEAVDEFIKLWNSTIKPADLPRYGWEANPWVWVIRFERLEGYK